MEMNKQKLVLGLAVVGLCFLCWWCYQRCNIDPCSKCLEKRSQESASMVFFNKKVICDSLLYRTFNGDNIIAKNSDTINTCKENWDSTYRLHGYYIELSFNINSPSNTFKFYPSWVGEGPNNIVEVVTQPITLGAIAELASIDTTNHTITTQEIQQGFHHNKFQFDTIATKPGQNPFAKAYISRYDLLLITNNSQFLGICGATLQSGNLAPDIDSLNLEYTENNEFFTYRFVGFNQDDTSPLTSSDAAVGKKRNSSLKLIKANRFKASSNGYNRSIPAEAYATPCPPMWYEQ